MRRDVVVLPFLCAAWTLTPATAAAQSLFSPGFESSGLSDSVAALAVFDPDGAGTTPARLYAGGDFAAGAGGVMSNLASWNGSTWSAVGSGTNAWVGALATFDADGAGPSASHLYVAGAFSLAGGIAAQHIARWDGVAFHALAQGVDDWAGTLCVFDDDGGGPRPALLYVGGSFGTAGSVAANGIARWNGSAFQSVGAGFDGPVAALAVFNGQLYAGGFFSKSGNSSVRSIARWSGSAWTAIGAGFDGPVHALEAFDPDGAGPQPAALIAGGGFKHSGLATLSGVARWNGSAWSDMAGGVSAIGAQPSIRSLKTVVENGTPRLYATGLFRAAGSACAGPAIVHDNLGCAGLLVVARWEGSAWTSLGTGSSCNANDEGRALIAFDDDSNGTASLFVGGHFSAVGTSSAAAISRWNGTSWTRLGTGQGMSGCVHALAAGTLPMTGMGTTPLAAAGDFTVAGTTLANHAAVWDGSAWNVVGTGPAGSMLDGRVNALHFEGAELLLGGAFQKAGGVVMNHIARWPGPGSDLQPLGAGVDGDVMAITSFQGRLLAGGKFASASGTEAINLAAWDGAAWSAIDSGADSTVRALLAFDDGTGPALFVAGDFATVGGLAAEGVARWDGAAWTEVGQGLCCGSVHALAVFDAGSGPALYAGGDFDRAGDTTVNGVARWDAAAGVWRALGAGVAGGRPSTVFTLTAWSRGGAPALLAGGDFAYAGDAPAKRLATWNGTSWSALGSGANGSVRSSALYSGGSSGPALFVGGEFTLVDGSAASRIARAQ